MGSGVWVLRFLIGAVIFCGVIWLMFAGVMANHATKTTTTTVTVPSSVIYKHWKSTAREKHHAHQDVDLNNVSKRRVPNGPDPIHNRKTSESRQPPGRI